MYCTYCEKLVSDKMAVRRQFCPYCGRKLHWFGIPDVELSKPIMQAILKRKNFLVRQKLEGIKEHYFKQRDVDLVFIEIQDSLQINPNNINARFQLGLYYYEKKRFDKAQEEFLNVLELDEFHKDSLFNLANIEVENEAYAKAIEYCNKVLMVEPENINALYNKAVGQYYLGDFDSALGTFKLILNIDEDNEAVKQAIQELSSKFN
ncbi:MAG: tetratricopeptide repeat protein [Candidatus Margulisbacteria bacterium]|nr:tetratricopeptide repeat protein [Candidatus Margulisiibacteriota bacterium]